MNKYETLGNNKISLPRESFETPVKFSALKPGPLALTKVLIDYALEQEGLN
jgi:hypothetical protein